MASYDFSADLDTIRDAAAAIDGLQTAAEGRALEELTDLGPSGSSALDAALDSFGATWSTAIGDLTDENAAMADGLRLCARTYADADDEAADRMTGVPK